MTIRESKKVSARKTVALIISIAAHAALAYYLITAALKYTLPEGEAPAEISFESPETTNNATDVEVVETANPVATMPTAEPVAPTPPPPPKPVEPKPPVPKPAPKVEAPPVVEPTKEASAEDVPVPTAVNEEPPEVEDVPSEEPQEEAPPVATAPVPVPIPIPTPTVEAPPTPAPIAAPAAAPIAPAVAAPPSPPAQAGSRESIGGGGLAPVQSDSVLIPLATNRAPPYPELALRKKLEGVTTVHYTVSAAGDVVDIKIVESSGHAILDNQIVSTIKTWKFKPPGKVGVYERPIRYRLTGEERSAPSRLRRGSP